MALGEPRCHNLRREGSDLSLVVRHEGSFHFPLSPIRSVYFRSAALYYRARSRRRHGIDTYMQSFARLRTVATIPIAIDRTGASKATRGRGDHEPRARSSFQRRYKFDRLLASEFVGRIFLWLRRGSSRNIEIFGTRRNEESMIIAKVEK